MSLKARKLNAKSIHVGRVFEAKENPCAWHQDTTLIITLLERNSESHDQLVQIVDCNCLLQYQWRKIVTPFARHSAKSC